MSKLHFTKMHGTGNDYVYVNLFTEQVDDASKLAVFCERQTFWNWLRWLDSDCTV